MTVAAARDFVAIGVLAARLQKSVRAIEEAADELGIVGAMRLNHVVYLDGEQVERLTEALANTGGK